MFLAAIAFFMYRDITPLSMKKMPEAPMDEFTAKGAASRAGLAKDERSRAETPLSRENRVEQKPGYKSLDMKQEYEKPAAPTPADKLAAAPAPAKPAEQSLLAKKETTTESRAFAPLASAPVMAENQAAPVTGLPAKTKSRQGDAVSILSTGKVPSFRDYRVAEVYTGKHARVDLSSHPEAKTWRTKLIEAANKGSNFAGHYTIATWGCGASCTAFGIIDAITGTVYFPAGLSRVSVAGLPEQQAGLQFRLDSKLLIVRGSPNEEDRTGTFYYVWEDNDLTLITYTTTK